MKPFRVPIPGGLNIRVPMEQKKKKKRDVTYFVGSNATSQIAVYKLENFQLTMISEDLLTSYLTQGLTKGSKK